MICFVRFIRPEGFVFLINDLMKNSHPTLLIKKHLNISQAQITTLKIQSAFINT